MFSLKKLIAIVAVMLTLVTALTSCGLSDEERQRRAEDYALLLESLQAVGYDNDFRGLKEKNSIEQNLRKLWTDYFSYPHFTDNDAHKNIELLLLLGNFDFIAEGLQSKASPDNVYYNDWPRDSQYNISSTTVSFSKNEVLWLMLLLPDSDFPNEHLGLREVLAECGKDVLGNGLSWPGTEEGIWFYYEKTNPGLLEKVNPYFLDHFSDEIKTAFKNADEDIQNRFMQAIDAESFRDMSYSDSPTRVFSFDEAEELISEFPPTGSWDGGYIRVVDDPTQREGFSRYGTSDYNINTSVHGAYIYARETDALVPAINPADARFAIYEEYTKGRYYATYTGSRDFDLYLLNLNIRIVDLLTGEEIFSESVLSNLPPEEISWSSYYGIGELRIVDGKYYYNDFDWGRYASVMAAHIK